MNGRPVQLLTFSSLYPNRESPVGGIFVETRLRRLLESGAARSTVVAPVPWFPFRSERFGEYARKARVPATENRHGIPVSHPRYPVIPKIGVAAAPALMAAGTYALTSRLADRTAAVLIDAHYFYPDGVAATWIARKLGLPVVITARGTDINLIPAMALPRRQIQWAIRQCDHMITVCEALRRALIELGAPADKVTTLRNGVDLEQFHMVSDRAGLRDRLGMKRTTLVSVGHLIERKGHHFIIEALAGLPDVDLWILGTGPWRARLERQIARFGLENRVRLLGQKPQEALAGYMAAADALVLASSREGWANVLLESMACGTAVVATDVWGTRECVAAPAAGVLVPERTAAALKAGIRKLLADPPGRRDTRRYAEGFSWDETTEGQIRIFRAILDARGRGGV